MNVENRSLNSWHSGRCLLMISNIHADKNKQTYSVGTFKNSCQVELSLPPQKRENKQTNKQAKKHTQKQTNQLIKIFERFLISLLRSCVTFQSWTICKSIILLFNFSRHPTQLALQLVVDTFNIDGKCDFTLLSSVSLGYFELTNQKVKI